MTSVKEFLYVHANKINQAFEYVDCNDLKRVCIKVWSPVQVYKVTVYDTFDIDIQHMTNARSGTDQKTEWMNV